MDQLILLDKPDQPTRPQPAARRKPVAKRRVAVPENGVLKLLIWLLAVSFFIPEDIHLLVGSLKITASFGVSMFLFPAIIIWGRIRWVWPDYVVGLLYAVYFICSYRWAPMAEAVETQGRLILGGATPYLVGRYVMQNPARMKRFLTLVVTTIAVLAVPAVFESFARFNIHSTLWGYEYRPHKDLRMGLTRAHGWTSHAIMFGLVNAIFVPLVAVAWLEKRDSIVGGWTLAKICMLMMGAFLSLSTGAWMPAVVSLFMVAWDYRAPLRTAIRWPLTFFVAISGYLLLEYASGRPLLRIAMMKLHISSPEAWFYRWRLYERVYSVMPGNWWLGYGETIPEEFQGLGWSIDNNFLVVLLKYGRIGLIVWVLVALSVFFYGGRAVWARHDTTIVRIARALGFSVIAVCLTQFSVALFSLASVLYWLTIGLAVGAALNCRTEAAALDKAKAKSPRRRPAPARRSPAPTAATPA
ncbi:MAG: hypothetical protein AAGH99_11235 [Planctomycetota bacterium]